MNWIYETNEEADDDPKPILRRNMGTATDQV